TGARHARSPAREEVEVHGRKEAEALEVVAVPVEAEPLHRADGQAGFLAQLAARGALDGLSSLHEASGDVEAAAARSVRAAQHEHVATLHHDRARAGARVVVHEIAAARAAERARASARGLGLRAADRPPAARARKR